MKLVPSGIWEPKPNSWNGPSNKVSNAVYILGAGGAKVGMVTGTKYS